MEILHRLHVLHLQWNREGKNTHARTHKQEKTYYRYGYQFSSTVGVNRVFILTGSSFRSLLTSVWVSPLWVERGGLMHRGKHDRTVFFRIKMFMKYGLWKFRNSYLKWFQIYWRIIFFLSRVSNEMCHSCRCFRIITKTVMNFSITDLSPVTAVDYPHLTPCVALYMWRYEFLSKGNAKIDHM